MLRPQPAIQTDAHRHEIRRPETWIADIIWQRETGDPGVSDWRNCADWRQSAR